jgi:hypothetical protein
MRALGKTPNDPLLQKMTPIQWKLCMHNVIEDEKEVNEKIKDLVDVAVKIFVGNPKPEEAGEGTGLPTVEGYVGQEPTKANPDISFKVGDVSMRKVMSTEFDKIVQSGGKYEGFKTEDVKE